MKTMTAKYPGICKRTGAKIHPGDQINYFGKGHAELVNSRQDDEDEGFAGGDEFEDAYEEDEREGHVSPAMLRADRQSAKNGVSVFRFSSGHVMTQNSKGRCEDAPCCGCCS